MSDSTEIIISSSSVPQAQAGIINSQTNKLEILCFNTFWHNPSPRGQQRAAFSSNNLKNFPQIYYRNN
jgi:hypothetical protein